jgi:4-hydroxybenzoate polyprenyltransferase
VLSAVALGLLLLAVSQLAPVTRWLWPIPVAMFAIYPYLKRVTPLCHLWLGASIGLAPVGAWIAVTDDVSWQPFLIGAVVACWVAGFDVIYATMDLEHDRRVGLHSVPADFGLPRALLVTRVLHGLAVVAMIAIGLELSLGVAYWAAVAICAVLLAYENSLVKPDDLSRVNAAFFNVNAILAAIYLAGVGLDVAIRG